MQYLLTQDELDDLKNKQYPYGVPTEQLQELCTKIANEMPVVWSWSGTTPVPWGCIHGREHVWYCDNYPVKTICPSDKSWWCK